MPRKNLTDRTVAALHPLIKGQVDYYDAKNPRFGIRISYNGARTWFVFDVDPQTGKRRRIKLGRYPEMNLAEARREALDHKHALTVEKRDPVAERKVQREALTFTGLIGVYLEQHAKPKKRSWKEDQRILNKYFTRWRDRRADGITRPEVVAILQDIKKNHGGVMANRSLAAVRKMYSYAVRNGYLDDNPAKMVDRPASETSRDRVYTDAEIKALWGAFDQMGVQGAILKMCFVTAQRLNEARGMRRDEIDGETWTLPAARSKNGRANVVPLSGLANHVLETTPNLGATYVFASPRGPDQDGNERPVTISSKDRVRARKLSGVADFSPHDLRRTFRTAVAPLGFDRYIGERVLGHVMQGVEPVYDRFDYLDQKRDLLEAWGRHVEDVIGEAGKVVQMMPKASA